MDCLSRFWRFHHARVLLRIRKRTLRKYEVEKSKEVDRTVLLDEEVKSHMKKVCLEVGISLTTTSTDEVSDV